MDYIMTDVVYRRDYPFYQEKSSLLEQIIKENNQGVARMVGESSDLPLAGRHLRASLKKVTCLMPFLQPTTLERPHFSGVSKSLYVYHRAEYDEGMNSFSYPVLLGEDVASANIAVTTLNFNMGQLYLRLNKDSEALSYFLRALQVGHWQGETVCGEAKSGVGIIALLHNIGHLHYRNGHHEDALQAYQRALEINQNACDQPSLPHRILGIADTLNCLGVIYFQLPHANPSKALELFRESLSLRRALLGFNCDDRQTANIENNIGRVHYMLREYAKARDCYSRALRIRTRLFGEDHLDVAASKFNLAQVLHRDGDPNAMELYAEYLRIAKDILGCHHRDIAGVLKCMAQVRHEARDLEGAAELYHQALEVGKACFGPYHPLHASIFNKLGNLYYELNHLDLAAQVYLQGLDVERAILEPDHPNIVVTLQNIAEIYKLQNKLDLSLIHYRQALAIQRRAGKKTGSESLSSTLSSIALIHYQRNRFSLSLEMYQEVLCIQRRTYGDDSLTVGSTLNAVALVLYKMDLHDLALQSFHESLKIRRARLGNDCKEIAVVLYNLATVHLELGQDEEAVALYREALRVEKVVLGAHHKDVVSTMMHLGKVHQQRGDFTEALDYYQQALGASRASKKEELDHAAVAHILNHIGNVHLHLGKARDLVMTLSESLRQFRLAGKSEDELVLSGFNFYALSKRHPECPAAA